MRRRNLQHPASVYATVLLFNLFVIAGCESYEPLPLDRNSVDRVLVFPNDHDLHARVADLKNPLIKSVEVEPENGLTPDQAAVLAVIINPALRAQRDRHGVSQAAVLQAGLLPNPQLTYSYDWNTGGTALGNINAYGIGVNYDITALISHTAKARSAEWAAESVDLTIAWQEWQTAEAAKIAVYDLLSLQQQRQVAGDIDSRLAENLKVVQQAVDLRLKTAIDLAAAESASRDAHAIVLQADHDVQHQLLMLKRALGVPPSTEIHLHNDLSLFVEFEPPALTALLDGLEDRRLDLVGLRQGYQAQEQTTVAAYLDQFPRVNLGFNRARDNTNVRSVGLGVNIEIPLFDHNQGAIAAEKANRQVLYDEYLSRVFDSRADIAQAFTDIHALNAQIKDAHDALPSLQQLVDVYKEAVDRGNADVLSYYTAWNTLAQKKLDVLRLEQQLADNRVALELATGRYFPDASAKPSSQP